MEQPIPPIPTVRVVSDETGLGYRIINLAEFDPLEHERYDPEEEHANDPDLPDVEPAIAGLTFGELRAEAKALGLKAGGSKADLQVAITEQLRQNAEDAARDAAARAAGEGAE